MRFWRDPDGPEVDFVVEDEGSLLPIEVKYTAAPRPGDARHLVTFLREYPQAAAGVVVCRTPRPFLLADRVRAVPWQQLPELLA